MAPGRLDEVGASALHAVKDEAMAKMQPASATDLSEQHDHVLKTYRILIADLCQQYNMGHPGYVNRFLLRR